jgi:hypothetical protein
MDTAVKKISWVEAILAILFTLIIDAVQIVLTFLVVGVFFGIVLDVLYIFVIGTWLFLANHLSKKSAYAFGGALLVEIIPVIQVFPAWTPFILYTIGQSRGWKAVKVFDKARSTVAKTKGGKVATVVTSQSPQVPVTKPINTPRTPLKDIKVADNTSSVTGRIGFNNARTMANTETQYTRPIPKPEPQNLLNLKDRQYNKEQPPNVLDLKKAK